MRILVEIEDWQWEERRGISVSETIDVQFLATSGFLLKADGEEKKLL